MSRVHALEAIPLRYPCVGGPYGSSRGVVSHRESTVVKVRLESGVVGLGEAFGPPIAICNLISEIEPQVTGLTVDIALPKLVRVANAGYNLGSGLFTCALSGVDAALWDALARTAGMSLAAILGGRARDSVTAYASAGYVVPGADIGEFRARLEEDSQGFTAAKIKCGLGLRADLERIQTALDVLGRDRQLMVDVNGNYTLEEAADLCRELSGLRVAWLEEPLAPEDLSGLERLHAYDVRIATGEALFTRYAFRDLLTRRLADVIQPDVTKVGGVSEMRALADMARAWLVRLSPHVWGGGIALATSLQVLSQVPDHPHATHVTGTAWLEFDRGENELRSRLLTRAFAVTDGQVAVPDAPGIGVELDDEFVDHLRMDR